MRRIFGVGWLSFFLFYIFCFPGPFIHSSTDYTALLSTHPAEEVHDIGKHNQQDTTTGAQTEHLRHETLVQGAEPFLLHDGGHGRPGPIVLGHLAGHLGGVLDPRLDHVHRGVEDGTDDTTNGTGNQVVAGLLALVTGLNLGKLGADLEDRAEVASIPEDVTPQGRFETVVHCERSFGLDNLLHDVQHAIVFGRAVLETDFDQFKGDNDECLGGTGGSTGQSSQALRLLLHTKQATVVRTPAVIGRELGRTLGGFHQNGGRDTTVQTGSAVRDGIDWISKKKKKKKKKKNISLSTGVESQRTPHS